MKIPYSSHQNAFSATPICPHCHSPHTQFIENRQLSAQPSSSAVAVFSPMALANIGMQLSRRLNLPPMLGSFTGLVIGGAVLLILNYQKPIHIRHYHCEQCHEDFETQNPT